VKRSESNHGNHQDQQSEICGQKVYTQAEEIPAEVLDGDYNYPNQADVFEVAVLHG